MIYRDRTAAGTDLATKLVLDGYGGEPVVVYGVANGGVVVAKEVAKALGAPLAVVVVSSIAHPSDASRAIGAVTSDGQPAWDQAELRQTTAAWRRQQIKLAASAAKLQLAKLVPLRHLPDCRGQIAIVVDDIAVTGLSAAAAIRFARQQNPSLVVCAVPAVSPAADLRLTMLADRLEVGHLLEEEPDDPAAVYQNFDPVPAEEVRLLLGSYRYTEQLLDLPAVNAVLSTVQRYPVTSRQLADQARTLNAPAGVVGFFESIPADRQFASKAEVMDSSAVTEVLEEEEEQQPNERLSSYD